MSQSDSRQYRVISYIDGRAVTDHLPVFTWEMLLLSVRGLRQMQRDRRIRPDVTFQVQTRAHGPAEWETVSR